MVVQKVQLDDVKANPYRSDRHVINEEKVERLMQSFDNSGFWDGSLQGRPSPTEPGKIEIAFGHHRLEAAKRKNLSTVGIVVAERSDADMLRMMADENSAEFKHDALVAVQTIAAVVDAFARGEIALDPVHPEAPHKQVLPGGKTYTLATVARFLNWVKPSTGEPTQACREAYDAYREAAAAREALSTLPPTERSEVTVEVVTQAARTARQTAQKAGLSPVAVRKAEKKAAERAAKEVTATNGLAAGDVADTIAWATVTEVAGKKREWKVSGEVHTSRLVEQCRTVTPYAKVINEARRLDPFLSPTLADQLAEALEEMLERSSQSVRELVRHLRSRHQPSAAGVLEAEPQHNHV